MIQNASDSKSNQHELKQVGVYLSIALIQWLHNIPNM